MRQQSRSERSIRRLQPTLPFPTTSLSKENPHAGALCRTGCITPHHVSADAMARHGYARFSQPAASGSTRNASRRTPSPPGTEPQPPHARLSFFSTERLHSRLLRPHCRRHHPDHPRSGSSLPITRQGVPDTAAAEWDASGHLPANAHAPASSQSQQCRSIATSLSFPGRTIKCRRPSAGSMVQMQFDNIELRDLIKFVSSIMGKNFIFDDNVVKGKVTILSPKSLTRDEVFRVFESVLNYYGFSIVSSPEAFKVVKAADAKATGHRESRQGEAARPPPLKRRSQHSSIRSNISIPIRWSGS